MQVSSNSQFFSRTLEEEREVELGPVGGRGDVEPGVVGGRRVAASL